MQNCTRFSPNLFYLAMTGLIFFVLSAGPLAAQENSAPPPPVDVAVPVVKKITEWDEYTGRFEAIERVEVHARVSGYLDSIHFRDGQQVSAGDILFVIDPRPYQAEVERAQAGVGVAEARLNLAIQEVRRIEKLLNSRAVSQEEVDIRRANQSEAQAAIKSAVAVLSAAELNLEFTQVRAPIAGRVSDRRVDVGNIVSGGSAQSTLLTTIVRFDPIYFVFDGSEADYLRYTRLNSAGTRLSSRDEPNPVYVRLMDETEWTRKGQMNFVDNEVNPNSGTIRGRALFDNPDNFLTPGLFGRLRLLGSGEYEAMLIPDKAILSDQARKIVMTVGDDGTVNPKIIVPGPLIDGLRVVRSGLEAGDRIIINGLLRARPGGKVTPELIVINPQDGSESAASAVTQSN